MGLLREQLQVSVLMHILISISYLAKDNFKEIHHKLGFISKIQKFVEVYSKISTTNNEALEIDKKTVLDLCAHMFHSEEVKDEEESNDVLDLCSEDRIREYEND